MDFINIVCEGAIVTARLSRGKVNALNESFIEQIRECFEDLEKKPDVRAVVLTGRGKFLSFGFDIPELYEYSKDEFKRFVTKFTDLYTYLFMYPKPIIAALNGHAIAWGCMLATACDYRLMVTGKAKISLNEITFGSTVFAGSVAMLKFLVGDRNAERILCPGDMYDAQQAKDMNLVDYISTEESIDDDALVIAKDFAKLEPDTFYSIKKLLRQPVVEEMLRREEESIREFLEIWYSENTRKNIERINIHN